jgi:hypothetical protein
MRIAPRLYARLFIGSLAITVAVALWVWRRQPPAPSPREKAAASAGRSGDPPATLGAPTTPSPARAAPQPGAAARTASTAGSAAPTGPAPNETESAADAARSQAQKQAIHDAVDAVMPAIQRCYERALAEDPNAGAGRIVAEFEIVGTPEGGHIESAEIAESFFRSPLNDQCVLNALADTHFPAPEGTRMTVRFPLKFGR